MSLAVRVASCLTNERTDGRTGGGRDGAFSRIWNAQRGGAVKEEGEVSQRKEQVRAKWSRKFPRAVPKRQQLLVKTIRRAGRGLHIFSAAPSRQTSDFARSLVDSKAGLTIIPNCDTRARAEIRGAYSLRCGRI